jgi:hypothetical protein
MYGILHDAGAAGLMTDEWYDKARGAVQPQLAPSKLHTTIVLLAYARRCCHRRIGRALGYDLKPLNRDAA